MYLRDESVDAFAAVPGLLFKAWIADEATDRWGAVYVWESREAAERPLPSRARELIGKDPEIAEVFDLEAIDRFIEGLARRKVAIERADADAGKARYGLQTRVAAAGAEYGLRRFQHALAIAHGIGAGLAGVVGMVVHIRQCRSRIG